MTEDDLRRFAQSLQSLWGVDVLLLLYREPAKAWTIATITRQLRSTEALTRGIVARLERQGLVAQQPDGTVRYVADGPTLKSLVERLSRLQAERPSTLVRDIYGAPNETLQDFSDAFRLKKD